MITPLQTSFGNFQGTQGDGVVQFRGVKYACLKDQLSVPEMVTSYRDELVDATEFGPRAPAMDGCAFEQSTLIQCFIGVPVDPPPMSGTECLNLNITIPDLNSDAVKKLPVMVFVHGGGFIMGANYWPQYDASRLVKLSAEFELPVVAININYRLGVLGNLTSQELRDAGYPGNNSLRDQKCALQWIKAHIEGFGGDADNVTVFGESAGAASVLYQLHSKEPLFKRCISMAGTPLMLKPLSPPVTKAAYQSIMQVFGLKDRSVEERIQDLRHMSSNELAEKTPMTVPLVPFLDGEIVTDTDNFAKLRGQVDLPGWKWCEELMIGESQHDGNVFWFMSLAQRKAGIAEALSASLRNNLPEDAAAAVLDAYGLSITADDDTAMQHVIELATDIAYFMPAFAYARSFPGKTYYYHFNEPNPWDGPFKGYSTHMLDAAFLFQTFNENMSSEARMVAKGMAADFVKFANSVKPWAEYRKGSEDAEKVRTYGPSDKKTLSMTINSGRGNGRRVVLLELSENGRVDLDQLSIAWDLFVAGK